MGVENWLFTVCRFLAYFGVFSPQILLQKAFLKNASACIILVLDATFVSHLTFLGLLSPEMFGEKIVTYKDTKTPSLFCHL